MSKRGITQKTIDDFKLGYAHDGWDHLLKYFSNKRISTVLLEKSGLILPRKNKSGHYDRFRNRIIFPIFVVKRKVVGSVTGRTQVFVKPKKVVRGTVLGAKKKDVGIMILLINPLVRILV